MFPKSITLITLGVADLARGRAFYEALGWEAASAPEGVVFIQLAGQVLALWGLDDLAADQKRPAAELGLHVGAQGVGVGAGLGQQPTGQALGLVEQGEQQMLPVDLGVAEPQRLGLSVVEGLLRLLGQSVEVHVSLR